MLIFAVVITVPFSISAQVTTGAIQGAAKDTTGAVIPGVTITVRHLDTGIVRNLETDAQGRYIASNLDLGRYEVRGEISGFQVAVRTGITLTIGAVAVVDLTLEVGTVAQEVVVTGEAPVVETTQSRVAALVARDQIEELPLNLRSFTDLAVLQEAVIQFRSTGGSSTGLGVQISFAGSRPDTNAYLLDGQDINSPFNKVPAGANGAVVGVDAVQEFQVLTNTYSAQFGKSMGGQLNAVTKAGTNTFHGSAFEFLRNDNMDARNFFEAGKSEFKRNQFGGSLGGPIVGDKTFFFGNYEGYRDRTGASSRLTVPSTNARRGILPGISTAENPIEIAPSVRPYLNNTDLFPMPDQPEVDLGNGRSERRVATNELTDNDFFLVRGDHYISDTDSIFARYANNDGIDEPTFANGFGTAIDITHRFLTVQETHIFSPQWLNSFRFGYMKSGHQTIEPEVAQIPTELWWNDLKTQAFPGSQGFGNLGIDGGGGTGGNRFHPRNLILDIYEVGNDLSYSSGSHTLKFGFLYKKILYQARGLLEGAGNMQFGSLEDFLLGIPDEFRSMLPGGETRRDIRQSMFGFYIHDDYQVRPGLTLNMGLRYEPITEPSEKNGLLTNLRDISDPAFNFVECDSLDQLKQEQHAGLFLVGEEKFTCGKPYYDNYSLKNFAPRIGFAWDVFGDGTTSVRGGFGLYFDHIIYNTYALPAHRNPPYMLVSILRGRNRVPFPNAFDAITTVTPRLSVHTVQGEPDPPYAQQWNFSFEREILPQTSLRIGYVGSRGHHLGRLIDNVAFSAIHENGRRYVPKENQRVRRNPNFGEVRQRTFDASSWYQGLTTALRKRMSHGLQMQVSYTFSKSLDTNSFFIGQGEAGNESQWSLIPEDPSFDKGFSSFDARHNVVLNATYDLPFGQGKAFGSGWTGFTEKLLGGWSITNILKLRTGLPTTAENGSNSALDGRSSSGNAARPDLLPGADNNPVIGDGRQADDSVDFAIRYYDTSSFTPAPRGFFGNLARNTIVGPGLSTVDFSLRKNTRLASVSEQFNIQFRFELFNLLNRANFGEPPRTAFTRSGNPRADAGRITSTSVPNRQIQLGLKVNW